MFLWDLWESKRGAVELCPCHLYTQEGVSCRSFKLGRLSVCCPIGGSMWEVLMVWRLWARAQQILITWLAPLQTHLEQDNLLLVFEPPATGIIHGMYGCSVTITDWLNEAVITMAIIYTEVNHGHEWGYKNYWVHCYGQLISLVHAVSKLMSGEHPL